MALVICPGVHEPSLSDRFLTALIHALSDQDLGDRAHPVYVLPTQDYAPFNGVAVRSYLSQQCQPHEPLIVLGFSAGVMGAMVAAQMWHCQRYQLDSDSESGIRAFIAVDGWGVPHIGSFPCHRISHDRFTHWSSALLGAGQDSFYADPPVDHLDLWQFPDRALGWSLRQAETGTKTTAIAFIAQLLGRYGCHQVFVPQ